MLTKTDDSQSLSDSASEEGPSHNIKNDLPKKQRRSKSVHSTLPTLPAIVRQPSQKSSANANTELRENAEESQYYTTDKESHDAILFEHRLKESYPIMLLEKYAFKAGQLEAYAPVAR